MEGLIEVCRIIDREGSDKILSDCASLFKKNKEHGYAKEVFLKLGDMKSLMGLHVEMEKWEEAFLLGKQNFLLKNDKF
jgi:intraflagellar transport protein 122